MTESALELFTAHGYAGATIEAIARRACVAAGTIYTHFPTKAELANAVYREVMQGVLHDLQRAAREPDAQGVLGLWQILTPAHRGAAEAFLLEVHDHREHFDDHSRTVARAVDDAMCALIDGGTSLPSRFVAALVRGAAAGVLRARCHHDREAMAAAGETLARALERPQGVSEPS